MTLAILEALDLWQRAEFPDAGRKLEFEWFDRVIKDWKVARLIEKVDKNKKCKDKNKKKVLEIFNDWFIKKPQNCLTAKGIDSLDVELRRLRLTPLGNPDKGGKRKRRRCISLVSKIAFFIRPGTFPPWDGLARSGLKKRTGDTYETYKTFLEAWNKQFKLERKEVSAACENDGWVFVIKKLELPAGVMNSPAFRRKVFDNVLMQEGRSSK